jgi:hypothetical protein
MNRENRFTKYRTYKNVEICYDNLFKHWVSNQICFFSPRLKEVKHNINVELSLRGLKKY